MGRLDTANQLLALNEYYSSPVCQQNFPGELRTFTANGDIDKTYYITMITSNFEYLV